MREAHLRRGTLTTRIAHVETRTYTVHNADQKAKTLVIEHPARTEYALVSPQQNEKTSSAYRFVVKLAPGATEKLAVTEERLDEAAVAIANLTPDVLLTYVQNKALSETAGKQLEQILERKRQLAGIDAEMRRVETRINALSRDQERVRENIRSLNQVSGQQQQVQVYAQQLASQERELATLRDRSSELHNRRSALEAEVNAMIEKVEF